MYIMIVRKRYKRVSGNKRPDLLCVLLGQALLSIQCHIFTQETESPKETVWKKGSSPMIFQALITYEFTGYGLQSPSQQVKSQRQSCLMPLKRHRAACIWTTPPSSFHLFLSNHNFFVDSFVANAAVRQSRGKQANNHGFRNSLKKSQLSIYSSLLRYIYNRGMRVIRLSYMTIVMYLSLYDYRCVSIVIWLSLCIYRYMTIVS